MIISKKHIFSYLTVSVLLFTSCNDSEKGNDSIDGKKKVDKKLLDSDRSFNTTFDGKLFSVPSPIQTALLIKSTGLDFNEDLLNSEANISTYIDDYKKALNLGVYGADLGYATLYNQNGKSIQYLNAIESLANDLGVAGTFDEDFLSKFEENSNDQSSMLIMLTDAFRKVDNFLKENERKNTSSLILTGGWIESMHFVGNLYRESKDKQILQRLGEQKQTLITLIDILANYNDTGENDLLIADLKSLKEHFDKIIITYEYVEPVTDKENQVTTFKNKMNISISQELEDEIISKINEIRNNIVD